MAERYYNYCTNIKTHSEAELWWNSLKVAAKVEIADELFEDKDYWIIRRRKVKA